MALLDGTDQLFAMLARGIDVPDLVLDRPAWQADALCREPAYVNVSWFPPKGGDGRPAKAVCARCIVADECLAYAVDNDLVGIWGGTSDRERRHRRLVVSRGKRAA